MISAPSRWLALLVLLAAGPPAAQAQPLRVVLDVDTQGGLTVTEVWRVAHQPGGQWTRRLPVDQAGPDGEVLRGRIEVVSVRLERPDAPAPTSIPIAPSADPARPADVGALPIDHQVLVYSRAVEVRVRQPPAAPGGGKQLQLRLEYYVPQAVRVSPPPPPVDVEETDEARAAREADLRARLTWGLDLLTLLSVDGCQLTLHLPPGTDARQVRVQLGLVSTDGIPTPLPLAIRRHGRTLELPPLRRLGERHDLRLHLDWPPGTLPRPTPMGRWLVTHDLWPAGLLLLAPLLVFGLRVGRGRWLRQRLAVMAARVGPERPEPLSPIDAEVLLRGRLSPFGVAAAVIDLGVRGILTLTGSPARLIIGRGPRWTEQATLTRGEQLLVAALTDAPRQTAIADVEGRFRPRLRQIQRAATESLVDRGLIHRPGLSPLTQWLSVALWMALTAVAFNGLARPLPIGADALLLGTLATAGLAGALVLAWALIDRQPWWTVAWSMPLCYPALLALGLILEAEHPFAWGLGLALPGSALLLHYAIWLEREASGREWATHEGLKVLGWLGRLRATLSHPKTLLDGPYGEDRFERDLPLAALLGNASRFTRKLRHHLIDEGWTHYSPPDWYVHDDGRLGLVAFSQRMTRCVSVMARAFGALLDNRPAAPSLTGRGATGRATRQAARAS